MWIHFNISKSLLFRFILENVIHLNIVTVITFVTSYFKIRNLFRRRISHQCRTPDSVGGNGHVGSAVIERSRHFWRQPHADYWRAGHHTHQIQSSLPSPDSRTGTDGNGSAGRPRTGRLRRRTWDRTTRRQRVRKLATVSRRPLLVGSNLAGRRAAGPRHATWRTTGTGRLWPASRSCRRGTGSCSSGGGSGPGPRSPWGGPCSSTPGPARTRDRRRCRPQRSEPTGPV